MCSIVLHHIWRTRNSWVFEQRKLPPVDASVKQILSTFASHFRYLERLWRSNQDKREELKQLKTHLLRIEPYASFYKDHPILLNQRFPALGRCWYIRATLPS